MPTARAPPRRLTGGCGGHFQPTPGALLVPGQGLASAGILAHPHPGGWAACFTSSDLAPCLCCGEREGAHVLGFGGPDTCLPRPWHMIPWSTPRMPNGSLGRSALGSALRGTAGTRLASWGCRSLASSWASPGARNKGRVWYGDLGGQVFSLTSSPAPGPLSVPFPSSGSLPTHPNSPYLRVAPCHTSALCLQVTSTEGPSLIDRPLHDALCPLGSF